MIDRSRILSTGSVPGAKAYEIRGLETGARVVAFVTAGVNGKSADDTAIGNLADASEQTLEALALYSGPALPLYSNGEHMLAAADCGVITMAVRS